jgi:hypothetical protein
MMFCRRSTSGARILADKGQSDPKPLDNNAFAESLQDYLDGRMTQDQRRDFETRVKLTPKHLEELSAAQKLARQLKDFGRDVLEEPVPERLQALLRAFKAKRGPYDN